MEEHIKYYGDIFHSTLTSNGEVTILKGRQRNGSADGQAGNCIRLGSGVSVLSYDRLLGSQGMGCAVFLQQRTKYSGKRYNVGVLGYSDLGIMIYFFGINFRYNKEY